MSADGEPPSRSDSVLARAVLLAAAKAGVQLTGARASEPPRSRDPASSRSSRPLLESSEDQFRRLIEAAPDAVVIWTRERAVFANPTLTRMLGYDQPHELFQLSLVEMVHSADRELTNARIRELLASRTATPPTECRLRRRDGSWAELEVVAIAVEWDGAPALLAIGRELTERKQLQAAQIQADRLSSIGTLAAGVAHEINNPLAYVLLNLQYLLRELPRAGGDSQTLSKLLGRLGEARHGAERVSAIVRDLRDFSQRDDEGRGPVDLRRVIGAAIKVARPLIDSHAELVEDYRDAPSVHGNAARLEQVFLNLLTNAAQALPEGASGNEIRVALFPEGSAYVAAEITDNGAGIDPLLLDRVFDPFFTTKRGVGVGLGLPICHSIVTSLGGEIKVDSQIGRGTTFRVRLPAEAALPPPLRRTPEPPRVEGTTRLRVLIVDDELPLASMLSRVLSDEHDVEITTHARDALALIQSRDFDVVLCDLLMPVMSGMDLYRELLVERPRLASRMVFMTGGAFTPRAAQFLASVSNACVEKPFDLNAVRRLVRQLGQAG